MPEVGIIWSLDIPCYLVAVAFRFLRLFRANEGKRE